MDGGPDKILMMVILKVVILPEIINSISMAEKPRSIRCPKVLAVRDVSFAYGQCSMKLFPRHILKVSDRKRRQLSIPWDSHRNRTRYPIMSQRSTVTRE